MIQRLAGGTAAAALRISRTISSVVGTLGERMAQAICLAVTLRSWLAKTYHFGY
jgi:hypothetical protein